MKCAWLFRNVAKSPSHSIVAKTAGTNRAPVCSRFELQRKLSTSLALRSVWPSDWAKPVADKKFYYDNPPVEGEAMSLTHVIAAPTRHYYSAFHDAKLEKFEKLILKKGKGSTASMLLRNTLRDIKAIQVKKYHQASDDVKPTIEVNPLVIFHQALENGTPVVALRTMTKGGAAFKVPYVLAEKKKVFIASNWILEHCRGRRPRTPLSQRLAKELLAAYEGQGSTIKRKLDSHREAELNRAFANMYWK